RGGRHERVGGLEPVAGDHQYDRLVARDASGGDELPRRGHGDAAGRLGEDPFVLGQEPDPVDELRVGHVLREAAAPADGARGVIAVRRVADGEAPGYRLRLDRTDLPAAVLYRGHDRIAASGLGAVAARRP